MHKRVLATLSTFVAILFQMSGLNGQDERGLSILPSSDEAYKNETSPDPVKSGVGNNHEDDFYFVTLSDVERRSNTFKYIYIIFNKHSARYLPIEWPDAEIKAKDIIPKGKTYNYYETNKSEYREINSHVNYGSKSEHEKRVPMYEAAFRLPNSQPKNAELSNRLNSRFQIDSRHGPIDFTFCSMYQGQFIIYQLGNLTDNFLDFECSQLERILNKIQKTRNVTIKYYESISPLKENEVFRNSEIEKRYKVFEGDKSIIQIPPKMYVLIVVESGDAFSPPGEKLVRFDLGKRHQRLASGRINLLVTDDVGQ